MAYAGRPLVVLVLALSVASCGSSAPSAPSPPVGALAAPFGLHVVSQRVTMLANEIVLGWAGTAPGYRMLIGSGVNGTDIKSVDVATLSYTFVAPRTANIYYARVVATNGDQFSAPTIDLPVSTLDLRDIIDALFFNAGPMSEGRSSFRPESVPAGVWRDGAHLRVLVSREAGESTRGLAQAAIDDYAAIVDGAITGTTELVDDDMRRPMRLDELAPFTIAVRVWPPVCPSNASGCANYGPAPLGPNAAFVNLRSPDVTGRTVGHELGHAYGLHHLFRANTHGSELRFLMSSPALTGTLSDPEKAAIAAARAGGIRSGTTRGEAIAAGLVLPYDRGRTNAQPSPVTRVAGLPRRN